MSSIQQYKDAMKRQKKIISDQNNELAARMDEIDRLKKRNQTLWRKLYEHQEKKWWQFWK